MEDMPHGRQLFRVIPKCRASDMRYATCRLGESEQESIQLSLSGGKRQKVGIHEDVCRQTAIHGAPECHWAKKC
jgi:hypothetical protein